MDGRLQAPYASFKLPRRGHFFAARSAKKRSIVTSPSEQSFIDSSLQGLALSQSGSAFQIAGCSHLMLTGEFPASTTLLDAQSVAGSEMPSEHLASPRAFETEDTSG